MNKKILLFALLAVLILGLSLVACKTVTVSIIPEALQLEVGDKVDFNGHVTIKVNNVVVDDPQIIWELTEGDESKAGVCKYTITFSYNGKDYTREGIVTFAEKQPQIDPPEDIVALIPPAEAINKNIGETINWTEYVTVTRNGVAVDGPVLTAVLIDGEEDFEGRCIYQVSYVYNGKTYKTEIKVRYWTAPIEPAKPVIEMTLEKSTFAVGTQIDWSQAIAITVDDVKVENLSEFDVKIEATLKEGNPSVAGECKYEVTVTCKEESKKETFTVKYVIEYDPNNVSLLETLLNKDYDSYTFTYFYYEVGLEDLYMRETDKVAYGSTSLWQISYEDVNLDGGGQQTTSTLDYYFWLNSQAKEVRVYSEYIIDDDREWRYVKYDADGDGYSNYIPMAFTLIDVKNEINAKWFENLDNVSFKAKDAFLQDIADVLFGVGTGETYTSIVIETDGTDVTAIKARYTTQGQTFDQTTGGYKDVRFDSVIELSWKDFDSTTVVLPDAEEYVPANDNEIPEYIDPATAEDLSDGQQAALTEALNKTYESITLTYMNDKGDMLYRYSGIFMLTPTSSYALNRELGQYKDWVISDITEEFYAHKLGNDVIQVWMMLSDKGDFQTDTDANYDEKYTLFDFGTYILINDFDLTADMFGYVDGFYVVKPDKLADLKIKFGAQIDVSNFTKFDVLTFAVKLDSNGNVSAWRLVADCETDKDAFYWDLKFAYSDFNNTTITLPDAALDHLQDVSDKQIDELNSALNADYSNATITDTISKKTMYFVGEDVTAKGVNEYGYEYTDVYKLANGKYYEVIGGNDTEITKAEFDYYVLNFYFNLIDVTKVKYDAQKQVYFISAEDVGQDELAPYFKGYFDYTDSTGNPVAFEITGFALTVQDGYVTSVKTYFNNGEITATATLANIGTTTVPQDASDNEAMEE